MQQADKSMERITATEEDTRKLRLLVLLLVATGIYFQRSTIPIEWGLALAVSYLVYVLSLLPAMIRHVPAPWLPWFIMAVDLVFVTGAVRLFGVNSPAFVLIPMVIVYYGNYYLGYAGSFVVATLAAFLYLGLAYADVADASLSRLLPMQIPLLYLLALFSSEGARHRRRAQQERQELAVLLQAERGARAALEMTTDVGSSLDMGVLLSELAHLTAKAGDCSHAMVRLVDKQSGELGQVGAFFGGKDISTGDLGTATPWEREAMASRKTVEVAQPSPDQLRSWKRCLPPPKHVLIVPLVEESNVLGTVLLARTTTDARLTAAQRELLHSLAHFFSLLIANARSYAATRQQSARLASELRGTVKEIERRQRRQDKNDLRRGALLLQPGAQSATLGGQALALSAREFDVLYLLAKGEGQAVSQEVLLREVWGESTGTRSNAVDVAINRLRRKLEEQAQAGSAIQTVRGVGYRLDVDSISRRGVPHEGQAANGGEAPPIVKRRRGERGGLLLEHVISLAIISIVVPALLVALSGVINNAFVYTDRALIVELGQSQIESSVKESFQASPASYAVVATPADYTVSVGTSQAVSYLYPNGSAVPEVLQAISITVTGYNGSLTVQGYKYRP